MKKIIFLIAGLFLGLYAMGQAPSSEVFNAAKPKGATKLNREQLLDYVHKNYKRSAVPLDKENTYQLDGLLVSFWGLSVNPDYNKSLKSSQSEILGYLKRNSENTINYSKIIDVNNIQFLVYEYQKGDETFLWFQSEFNKEYKNINGVIQFKKPDEDKAKAELERLLKSIHFKE